MKRFASTLRRYDIERPTDLLRLVAALALVSGAAGSGIALLTVLQFG